MLTFSSFDPSLKFPECQYYDCSIYESKNDSRIIAKHTDCLKLDSAIIAKIGEAGHHGHEHARVFWLLEIVADHTV